MNASRWLGWLFVLAGLAFTPLAWSGEQRDVVISLDVPSELLPTRVCVRAPRIDKTLSVPRKDARSGFFLRSELDCTDAKKEGRCNACRVPSEGTGGIVCAMSSDVEAPSTSAPRSLTESRDLVLQLDNAGLDSLSFTGSDVTLSVEAAESGPVRVKPLGGAYHEGLPRVIPASGAIAIELRNRCVDRPLRYTAPAESKRGPEPRGKPGDRPAREPLTEQSLGTSLRINGRSVPISPGQRDNVDGEVARLTVPEAGGVSTLELRRGDTLYQGTFVYPSVGPVELLVTRFSFVWRKSCFVTERRGAKDEPRPRAKECPNVTVIDSGLNCLKADQGSDCRYTCRSKQPMPFPLGVRFGLQSPTRQRIDGRVQDPASVDEIVWEDQVRFPGDVRSSFSPSDARRVYLNWPNEDWHEKGREIDALEITVPDGTVHRLVEHADSLPVTGLQCPSTFSYRYLGRIPHRIKPHVARGDRLDVPPPSKRWQAVVMGVHMHLGGLHHFSVDSNASLSAAGDVEVTALFSDFLSLGFLWGGRAELSVVGSANRLPASLTFEQEAARWSTATQAKVLGYFGYRLHPSRSFYFGPSIGGGYATRALFGDWSEALPDLVWSMRMRTGYEVSNAVAIELPVTLFFGEQYAAKRQTAAGPLSTEAKDSWSLSVGLGLQWADVF